MFKRFRDRRVDEATREKYRENRLKASDFILPLFILDGENRVEEVSSMPGVNRYSIDKVIPYIDSLIPLGLESVLIFGVPDDKGLSTCDSAEGLVQQAIKAIKAAFPKLEVIADVCICSYTHDGHCHIGDNDKTCELLAKIAVSYAEAGADIVAPSDMMDGRVLYIKQALDEAGLQTPIMSYAAKFASAFYGPFRDAADCAPQEGDRRGYQMDPPNGDEALEEIAADFEEGTTSIIVKPALSYMDIVRRAREAWPEAEINVYNVSGEYSMVKQAIKTGLMAPAAMDEVLVSFKRAGATRIITYETADWLQRNR